MKRAAVIPCCLFAAGCLFWFFPLFHVVHTNSGGVAAHDSAFDPSDFAKRFWNERLIPSLSQAPDAATVLAAFRASPVAARAKFGRTVGVSSTALLVIRGNGTIVTVDKKGVGVALERDAKGPDIVLQTGLLFGNTVRDATGLIDAGNFSDSRQFNEISTELNRIIETRVIPTLKEKSARGRQISFAGCAEIQDESEIVRPLKIIPLVVRVEFDSSPR
jgi:predicted lipoprotein